ncbi:MAG TPA: T9SS type A sorting domain-containing protein [Bacteroidetes bacterium]|nr:T9SS type A sorting domain-containing protein [Bacteroidota bacterium]
MPLVELATFEKLPVAVFYNREAFAAATAKVLKKYFEKHYFGAGFLDNGCNILSTISPEIKNQNTELNIYPNPVSDCLYLELNTHPNSDFTISVFNNTEQVIYNKNHFGKYRAKINCSNFIPGLYFLKTGNKKFTEIRKFVK